MKHINRIYNIIEENSWEVVVSKIYDGKPELTTIYQAPAGQYPWDGILFFVNDTENSETKRVWLLYSGDINLYEYIIEDWHKQDMVYHINSQLGPQQLAIANNNRPRLKFGDDWVAKR